MSTVNIVTSITLRIATSVLHLKKCQWPCNSWFFDAISVLQIRVPSASPWVAFGAVLGEMPDTGSPETVEQFLILSCPLIISASGGPRVPAGFLLARL